MIKKRVSAKIVQMDGVEGFACYLSPTAKKGRAIIGLNVEALIAGVAAKDFKAKDLPYIIADSVMHEVIHVLEEWAKVQFSDKKVERLIAAYRRHYSKACR